jgi:hypothetical protein
VAVKARGDACAEEAVDLAAEAANAIAKGRTKMLNKARQQKKRKADAEIASGTHGRVFSVKRSALW